MNVLISIQQPVKQWQIPVEGVETLRKRFPHIRFIHATTPEQRADALADCDIAYTWILEDDEAAQAPKLRWVHTSAVAVAAERGFLRTLEGGCQVPVAAHATLDAAGELRLHGRVVSLGGERGVEGIETDRAQDERAAADLGEALAARLLDEGAASILAEVRGAGAAPAVPEP